MPNGGVGSPLSSSVPLLRRFRPFPWREGDVAPSAACRLSLTSNKRALWVGATRAKAMVATAARDAQKQAKVMPSGASAA